MKKKKDNYIYHNFKLAIKDIKKLKNYLIFSILVFFLFIVLGLIFPNFFEEQNSPVSPFFQNAITFFCI